MEVVSSYFVKSNKSSGFHYFQNSQVKRKSKPAGSLEYHVESGDTIEKIALKWNAVPSEILHLNRLVTRVIFPGKLLFSGLF